MRRCIFLPLILALPTATATAQSSAAPAPARNQVIISLGRAYYTNNGWPGTSVSVGLDRRLSARSLFSLQPRLGAFRADAAALEPDKRPGEKYAVGLVEAALTVRTSRRPERLSLRAEAGPSFFVGREISLYREPGTYLNPDGVSTTIVTQNEYRRTAIHHPGFLLGVGLDATVQERLYVSFSLSSHTYSYFPGDLLGAQVRVGYVLR